MNIIYISMCTVKPAYGITSFKQSPVLKGHLFPVIENFIWIEHLLRGHLSWKTKRWHLDTGLAVHLETMKALSSIEPVEMQRDWYASVQKRFKIGLEWTTYIDSNLILALHPSLLQQSPSYKAIHVIMPDFRWTEIVKYFLIVPLKRGHPSYKTMLSLQKCWSYKRESS